jgi:hypothetical protein
MKKLMSLFLLAPAALLFSAVQAQGVPAPVKAAFEAKHPGVTPEWEKEGAEYEAEYMANGREHSIVFTAAGVVVAEEMEITAKELPAAITEYVKNHLNGKKIDEAARINQADGKVIYEAEVGGKDYLFDDKGSLLGTEEEDGEDEDGDDK